MKINYKMKYGQEGLFLDLYHKDDKLDRVIISKDYYKIFNFLGLSYEKWEDGFDELENIFEYISESKFFDWRMFQMSKLNKINRERNLKRKSYMSFLDWMLENASDEQHEKKIDLSIYNFKYISDFFPEANLVLEVRRLEYEHSKAKYVKTKFNGGYVMRKYGLKDKALGDAMTGFKKYIEESILGPYENYILSTSIELIYKRFETFLSLIEINK